MAHAELIEGLLLGGAGSEAEQWHRDGEGREGRGPTLGEVGKDTSEFRGTDHNCHNSQLSHHMMVSQCFVGVQVGRRIGQ